METFEPPITVAMREVQRFGVVGPLKNTQRNAALEAQITSAAMPCLSSLQTDPGENVNGTLEGVISEGKVELSMWEERFAPAGFHKCVRLKLKKLKLPEQHTSISVRLSNGIPMDDL